MIQSKIIADSIGPQGDRLTTFVVTFPRIILAEFNTHRMFSRNSASSRAIPFEKMVKSVENNPFIPIAWQVDHKGMQGSKYISDKRHIKMATQEWLKARDCAVQQARILNNGIFKAAGIDASRHLISESIPDTQITKQLCNRILEPFMWHTVIITSGKEGLDNFFNLRCPQYKINGGIYNSKKDAINIEPEKDTPAIDDILGWLLINKSQAEIHIQALAEAMWDTYNESKPKELQAGEWHIPFGDKLDINSLHDYGIVEMDNCYDIDELKVAVATARCARVSYTVVGEEDKPDNYANDIKLHDRLAKSGHWSPFEHCAVAMTDNKYMTYTHTFPGPSDRFKEDIGKQVEIESKQGLYTMNRGWCRNFRGFIQYRELVS